MVTKAATQQGGRKRTSRSGATSSFAAVSPAEHCRSASDAVAKIRYQTMNSDPGHSREEEDIDDKTLTSFSLRDNKSFDDSGSAAVRGLTAEAVPSYEPCNLNASLKSNYNEQFKQQGKLNPYLHANAMASSFCWVGKLHADHRAAARWCYQCKHTILSASHIYASGIAEADYVAGVNSRDIQLNFKTVVDLESVLTALPWISNKPVQPQLAASAASSSAYNAAQHAGNYSSSSHLEFMDLDENNTAERRAQRISVQLRDTTIDALLGIPMAKKRSVGGTPSLSKITASRLALRRSLQMLASRLPNWNAPE
ncbi:hypothetical protein BJ742DRAFT_737114 [Cladochytrium replicatum]|nr:hypothetical protein BJ742DRAFT_737114 [Cladochytrium replicatum]